MQNAKKNTNMTRMGGTGADSEIIHTYETLVVFYYTSYKFQCLT